MNRAEFEAYRPQTHEYKLADGKTVPLNELSLKERNWLFNKIRANQSDPLLNQVFLVLASCPFYNVESEKDLQALLALPAKLIEELSTFASEINSWNEEGRDEVKKSLKAIKS